MELDYLSSGANENEHKRWHTSLCPACQCARWHASLQYRIQCLRATPESRQPPQ